MKWINMAGVTLFWILLCFRTGHSLVRGVSIVCGFPGNPAHGRPHPIREQYATGEAVTFLCTPPTYLHGNAQRVCTKEGTWRPLQLPICERSLPGPDLLASSRATLRLYPANHTVDGDTRTCTYTDKMRPRWVRLDLRHTQKVRALQVTVPQGAYLQEPAHLTIYTISVRDATTATYHKCASFVGKFAASTIRLSCASGGVEGRYVHVEDNRNKVDYFSLCEVDVFVHRDSYECGDTERPAHSVATRSGDSVIYRCVYGFRLEGPQQRDCDPNTGQWMPLQQPRCLEIICPPVDLVENGRLLYAGGRSELPSLGTLVNVSCDYGYRMAGRPIVCQEDGTWSSGNITCLPIDCSIPTFEWGDVVLLNGTRYGSVALLRCGDQENYTVCREDGTWSNPVELLEQCDPKHNSLSKLGLVEDDPDDVPTGVVVAMAVVVFVLLLLVVLVLLLKRRKVFRENSLDSLPSKAEPASVATPTQSEGDAFYDTIPHSPKSRRSFFRTVLFPPIRKSRGTSKDIGMESADSSTTNGCIYDEIGGGNKNNSDVQKKTAKEDTPVYAQVDMDEKRRSRLSKSRQNEQFDPVDPPTWQGTYHSETAPSFDEVDLEPIKLRELPPIPDEGGSAGTYASLSHPLDPPTLIRTNQIYEESPYASTQIHALQTIMKDNELYSTNDDVVKLKF